MHTKINNHYVTYTLFNSAKALVSILGPIYLYRTGYSFQAIIIFFIITAVFKVAALPVVFKLIARYGSAPVMRVGVLTMCLHFAYFASIQSTDSSLVPLAFFLGIANASFYPPFRVGFSASIKSTSSGTQAAYLNTLTLCFGAIAPVVGGIIASFWNLSAVYILAIICFLAVLIFIPVRQSACRQQFRFRDVPRSTALRQYGANALYSTSGLADMIVWPLFLGLLLPSYALLGIYAGLLVLLAAIIQLWTGHNSDRHGERRYLIIGTGLQTMHNILRAAATTLPHVFGLSILSAIGSSLVASAYGKQFYDSIQPAQRLEYLFGLELANSITWLIYFPILLAVSYAFPFEIALKIGILLVVPATFGLALLSNKPKLLAKQTVV